MNRRLYDVADLLAMFPRSRTQLYRDMNAGLLTFTQVGSRRYFEPDDVDRYVEALKSERPTAQQLVELIDADGRIDVASIPQGTTLADLSEAKRLVRSGRHGEQVDDPQPAA